LVVGIPGFEPGTFAVSVQCSNQMSYIPMLAQNVRIELTREAFGEPTVTLTVSCVFVLSGRRESNSQPLDWKSRALPIELLPQLNVDPVRIELTTLSVQGRIAKALEHANPN
jgi:hypothetical protein